MLKKNKLHKLESLRGLSAIYVVLHHTISADLKIFNLPLGLLFRFGQESVIIFFILSGFVINYSFTLSADKKFSSYFTNRFLRIFTPLIFIFPLGYILKCIKTASLADPEPLNLLLNIMMLQDATSLKPNVIVSPYMDNLPLWSLSYEWWFYMLYYPIQKYTKLNHNKSLLVLTISSMAAVIYIFSPTFIPRILMYLSIWWIGVSLSNIELGDKNFSLSKMYITIINLVIISIILISNIIIFSASGEKTTIGIHPMLEARHHIFALLAIFTCLLWKKHNWVMFDNIVSPFSILAPISYVMYISHQYIAVNVSYFSFFNNKFLEVCAYLMLLIFLSWITEVIVCRKISAKIKNLSTKNQTV